MHSPDELKALVEEALERLELWPELHGQATSVRYSLEVGGKRVRPVIALAVGEALGAPVGAGHAGGARDRARPHVLARPRRPARRWTTTRNGAASRRRGRSSGRGRRARRRRAARGGGSARGALRVVGGRARARRGDARDDRRPVPRHDGRGLRPRRRAPAEDRAALLRVGRRWRSGRPSCRRRSRRRGARSRRSSGSCSRSSTTSSTRTATSASTAPTARGATPTRRRSGRVRGSTGSTRTRPCSATSSTGSPCGRLERRRRRWPRSTSGGARYSTSAVVLGPVGIDEVPAGASSSAAYLGITCTWTWRSSFGRPRAEVVGSKGATDPVDRHRNSSRSSSHSSTVRSATDSSWRRERDQQLPEQVLVAVDGDAPMRGLPDHRRQELPVDNRITLIGLHDGDHRNVKKRLDVLLVERGLAESRAQAQALVIAGLVAGLRQAGPAGRRGRRARGRAAAAVRLARRREARARPRRARRRSRRPRLRRRRSVDRRLHRRPPRARRGARDRARRRLRAAPPAAALRPARHRDRANERAHADRASVRAAARGLRRLVHLRAASRCRRCCASARRAGRPSCSSSRSSRRGATTWGRAASCATTRCDAASCARSPKRRSAGRRASRGVVDSGLPGPKGTARSSSTSSHSEQPTLPDDLDERIDAALAG